MIKPLVFVVMPFGKKFDPSGIHEIDFDRVYESAIKPAVLSKGFEVLRADEERSGGIIHVPMFERLLVAEMVIADLTLLNANVFYELGVRHSAKPKTTILIHAKENQLPFDVHMVRSIPYTLEHGYLSKQSSETLKTNILKRLEQASFEVNGTDSPLFQLVSSYPGIDLPHEVTESFRDRARYIDNIRENIKDIRHKTDKKEAIKAMVELEESLGGFNSTLSEILVDLLLSYRDIDAYSEMISLVDRLPKSISEAVTVQEQYAFALNRRNSGDDRRKAEQILLSIIETHGFSPETCGLLGRVYKDNWKTAVGSGEDARASACLNEAIYWYRKGFESDPRDYYPGINLVTLLFQKGSEECLREMAEIRPAVSFAVGRRGGLNSRDYWDIATIIELSVIAQDWISAKRAVEKAIIYAAASWNLRTTIDNLEILRTIFKGMGNQTEELDALMHTLTESANQMLT